MVDGIGQLKKTVQPLSDKVWKVPFLIIDRQRIKEYFPNSLATNLVDEPAAAKKDEYRELNPAIKQIISAVKRILSIVQKKTV